tara:strand:- start:5118 stop:5510 length:393 start_codon:yes stop_codon:yes gene_type:complete
MVYECLIEPRINEYLTNYHDIPDECFSTTSTEGIILTVLIFMLLSRLLQILFNLLHKGGVSKLLIVLEKKFNLHLPKEDNFENIKLIEIVRLLVIVIIGFVIITSFVVTLGLFANYLASLALNATGWTLS